MSYLLTEGKVLCDEIGRHGKRENLLEARSVVDDGRSDEEVGGGIQVLSKCVLDLLCQ